MSFNYMDIAVVVIMLLCVISAKRRGITYFAVSAIGKIISLVLSFTLYGTVSRELRKTPAFTYIKERARQLVDIENIFEIAGFSEHIMANDNSEIYKLFRVDTFEDYISSYIANIAVNIISIIAVYMGVSMIIRLMFRTNYVLSGLPVIRHINGITGILAGFIEGVIIIWLLIIVLIFFALQGKLVNLYEALLSSQLAVYFLRYNIFTTVVFKVTA